MLRALVVLLFVALCFQASSHDIVLAQNERSPLADLLCFIPDLPDYTEAVVYGDIAAWKTSWDMPFINAFEDVEQLDRYKRSYWTNILSVQTMPPSVLNYVQDGEFENTIGFGLHNIDRFIYAGTDDRIITIVEHATTDFELGLKLESIGFSSQDTRQGQLFTYGDHLYNFNNIQVMPRNQLIFAREHDEIGLANAAYDQVIPSLSLNANYQAAIEVLESETLSQLGALTGIVFFDGHLLSSMGAAFALTPGTPPAKAESEIARIIDEWPPLSPYDLAALATMHGDGYTYQVILLIAPDDVRADLQAKSIEARLAFFKPRYMPKAYMVEFGLEFFEVNSVQLNDKAVAIVVMRATDPPLEFPKGSLNPPNSVPTRVPSWYELIKKFEIGFLAVTNFGTALPA